MDLTTVGTYFDLFLAFAAIVAVIFGFFRWANRGLENKILHEIRDATRQIQPGANGGLSLSDVARGVAELKDGNKAIHAEIRALDEKFTARMDESEKARERIIEATASDRTAWVNALKAQGLKVPEENPVKIGKAAS